MATETAPVCPRCGRLDAVRKVTSIVSEGVSTGQYQSVAPVQWQGKTYYLPVQREVVSSTVLAQRLMPPRIPEKWNPSILLFVVPFIGGVVFFWIAKLVINGMLIPLVGIDTAVKVVQSTDPVVGGCIALSVFLFGCALTFVLFMPYVNSQTKKGELLRSIAQRAMQKWMSLYYCSRDDGVFIPGQGRFVPIGQMQSFLYE